MKHLLATLLCLSVLGLSAASSGQDPVKVSTHSGHLGRHLDILEDRSAVLPVDSVIGHAGFRPASTSVPNLGISSSAFWARLNVENDSEENYVFLDLEHAEVEMVDVYIVQNGMVKVIARTGQSRTLETRSVAQPEFVFSLPIPKGQTASILIRLSSAKQLQVPLRLHTPASFAQTRSSKNLLLGIYVGVMLALALYNFFVYLSIRDKSYIIYVQYILLVGLTQLAFWGIGQFYLWSGSPWFSIKASIIFTFATAMAASEFMKSFIDTRHKASRLHAGIKYFYGLFAVVMVFYLFLDPSIGYQLAQVSAGLFASYLYFTIWKVWRQGSRQAGYFLVAWTVFLVGTMVFTLKDMGILPYNDITVFTMPLGSAIEGVLLSFGLADRINVLRKEKEQSQAESLRVLQENERIIREQNVVLEQKVKERTHALQESNDNLKRTQTQLVNAEKMASLGQLTAGIAHEINNPINFITSNVQPLRRNIREIVEVMEAYRAIGPADADRQLEAVRSKERAMDLDESIAELDDIIDSIAEGSSRTAEIVRGLRNFSRLDEDDLKEADLNEGLRSTLAVLAPQFRDKVSIELDLGAIRPVECFPGKVNQVFMNVITNAVQATLQRPGDRQRVVHVSSIQQDDRVLIRISDNGVGMTDDVKVRIYDPFFTTKAVGEGTGLGMAIVYGIIQDHQGDIRVESSPGVGTEFTIDLPVRHQRANQQRA